MATERMTLASMCGGGVQERINRGLAKLSDNILDPNTEAKKKRELTIKITLTPNEDDREDVTVDVVTSLKLAPEMKLSTQLYINKDYRTGAVSITEHAKGQIKGQLSLDDMGMEMNPGAEPTANELGCDPETGEIMDNGADVIDMRRAMNG